METPSSQHPLKLQSLFLFRPAGCRFSCDQGEEITNLQSSVQNLFNLNRTVFYEGASEYTINSIPEFDILIEKLEKVRKFLQQHNLSSTLVPLIEKTLVAKKNTDVKAHFEREKNFLKDGTRIIINLSLCAKVYEFLSEFSQFPLSLAYESERRQIGELDSSLIKVFEDLYVCAYRALPYLFQIAVYDSLIENVNYFEIPEADDGSEEYIQKVTKGLRDILGVPEFLLETDSEVLNKNLADMISYSGTESYTWSHEHRTPLSLRTGNNFSINKESLRNISDYLTHIRNHIPDLYRDQVEFLNQIENKSARDDKSDPVYVKPSDLTIEKIEDILKSHYRNFHQKGYVSYVATEETFESNTEMYEKVLNKLKEFAPNAKISYLRKVFVEFHGAFSTARYRINRPGRKVYQRNNLNLDQVSTLNDFRNLKPFVCISDLDTKENKEKKKYINKYKDYYIELPADSSAKMFLGNAWLLYVRLPNLNTHAEDNPVIISTVRELEEAYREFCPPIDITKSPVASEGIIDPEPFLNELKNRDPDDLVYICNGLNCERITKEAAEQEGADFHSPLINLKNLLEYFVIFLSRGRAIKNENLVVMPLNNLRSEVKARINRVMLAPAEPLTLPQDMAPVAPSVELTNVAQDTTQTTADDLEINF